MAHHIRGLDRGSKNVILQAFPALASDRLKDSVVCVLRSLWPPGSQRRDCCIQQAPGLLSQVHPLCRWQRTVNRIFVV
jgi:hypothetical protein